MYVVQRRDHRREKGHVRIRNRILTRSIKSPEDITPGNPLRPVITSNNITPKLNMSDLRVTAPPCTYSGAM
jgi:hypothetical protein